MPNALHALEWNFCKCLSRLIFLGEIVSICRVNTITPKEAPARNRLYDVAVRQALKVLWEAADRVYGKRLKALIPMLVDAMDTMVTST